MSEIHTSLDFRHLLYTIEVDKLEVDQDLLRVQICSLLIVDNDRTSIL